MKFRFRQMLSTLIALVVTSGCGVEPEAAETLRQVAVQSGYVQMPLVKPAEVTQVRATFDPTHPDRIDPFSFPDESLLESPGVDTSIKSAAQVDVVGFADLGQPRVLVRARDKTHSLAVGDKIYGIEVVEINPPTARLRMGGLTWTANMFGKTSP